MKKNSDLQPVATLFGKMLNDKRTRAGMSLAELSTLTRLPCDLLRNYEEGKGSRPTFDICYKLAIAINSREMQGFTIQELWEAASMDGKMRAAQYAA